LRETGKSIYCHVRVSVGEHIAPEKNPLETDTVAQLSSSHKEASNDTDEQLAQTREDNNMLQLNTSSGSNSSCEIENFELGSICQEPLPVPLPVTPADASALSVGDDSVFVGHTSKGKQT
jgi:hypothetical protein